MFYDHCIFKIHVRFTQTVHHRDTDGDVRETTKHPGTEKTFHLVADKYMPDMAETWVKDRFRFDKDAALEILSVEQIELNGCLINFMRM